MQAPVMTGRFTPHPAEGANFDADCVNIDVSPPERTSAQYALLVTLSVHFSESGEWREGPRIDFSPPMLLPLAEALGYFYHRSLLGDGPFEAEYGERIYCRFSLERVLYVDLFEADGNFCVRVSNKYPSENEGDEMERRARATVLRQTDLPTAAHQLRKAWDFCLAKTQEASTPKLR